jgi:hypothetical protein
MPPSSGHDYPLTFPIDYPDRSLNRLTTAFRIFTVIPIAILAATIEGGGFGSQAGGESVRYAGGGIGILVIPVLLMLLFRRKYPAGGTTGTCSSAASAIGSWHTWH